MGVGLFSRGELLHFQGGQIIIHDKSQPLGILQGATKLQFLIFFECISASYSCCGCIYRRILETKTSDESPVFFSQRRSHGLATQAKGEGGLGGWRRGVFLTPEDGGVLPCSDGLLGKCSAWNDFSLLYTGGCSGGVSFRLYRRSGLTTKNLQSMPAAKVVFGSSRFPINDMNVCFGEALILAVHSCPAWPTDKDLPNVPAQADNLKKVFQDLGLNVTRPQQEELTHEGVKLCVADLCRRTSDKLKKIKEDALFVAVAVLSHGRLSDSFSELPAMVCYDSLGVLDASNDADLDGILLSGFNSIEVPVGKHLKVWLILDCCQSNEHISTWRGPGTNLGARRQRLTFGRPSSVDFMTLLSCDPGRESHDIYSMSRALAEVLEPKKPILLYVACESAMKSVEGWSSGMVRPSLKQRGEFSSLRLFNHNASMEEVVVSVEGILFIWRRLLFCWILFSYPPVHVWHRRLASWQCPLTMFDCIACLFASAICTRLFKKYCKKPTKIVDKDEETIQAGAFSFMWAHIIVCLHWGVSGNLQELIPFATCVWGILFPNLRIQLKFL